MRWHWISCIKTVTLSPACILYGNILTSILSVLPQYMSRSRTTNCKNRSNTAKVKLDFYNYYDEQTKSPSGSRVGAIYVWAIQMYCPPRWRRGNRLDCGSVDPGLIPGIPSMCLGPLMARRLKTSRCPCRGRLCTLKSPSCPWRWVPGSRSKFGLDNCPVTI